MLEKLWVEKYRPKTLDECVFQNAAHKAAFTEMVNKKSFNHLLLSGIQGTGKTTLARVLVRLCGVEDTDVMVINASDENNAETIRDRIKSFVSTYAMGDFKVVVLDEADYITKTGQAILRGVMETYADSARFILTCNYQNKLMEAVKSRCQQYHFDAGDPNDIALLVANILVKENVEFDLDVLDELVKSFYPDIRKTINAAQQFSSSGVLKYSLETASTTADYKHQLLNLVDSGQWSQARTLIAASVGNDQWDEFYRFLYDNIHVAKTFKKDSAKWEQAIDLIAEYLYKHSFVSDPEINAVALLINLSRI